MYNANNASYRPPYNFENPSQGDFNLTGYDPYSDAFAAELDSVNANYHGASFEQTMPTAEQQYNNQDLCPESKELLIIGDYLDQARTRLLDAQEYM